ncbi:MAG: hypothetical protein ABW133_24490 [Polyangiaceae bacterium]
MNTLPFVRKEFVEAPGIVGAEWWNESVQAPVSRRHLLVGSIIATSVLGATVYVLTRPDPTTFDAKPSLDMQRQFGWDFGATDQSFPEGATGQPFDATLLATLADQLRPSEARHRPYYVPTLFQAPSAIPRGLVGDGSDPGKNLRDVLRPVMTPAMRTAFGTGRGIGSLFADLNRDTLVIVDLPGPESIAFAAGASQSFDPTFLFDNWPHPYGVVKAHQTLAAALTLATEFQNASKTRRGDAPGLLVLDRDRLAPYSESPSQFDNRYVAKLPDAASLRSMGYAHVICVVPQDGDPEADDLNDDFVAYQAANLSTRLLGASAFARDNSVAPRPVDATKRDYDDGGTYAYGGSVHTNPWFWHHYALARAIAPARPAPLFRSPSIGIAPRMSLFSGAGAQVAAGSRIRPPAFATTPVVVDKTDGRILGSKWTRSGSWMRSSGSGSG